MQKHKTGRSMLAKGQNHNGERSPLRRRAGEWRSPRERCKHSQNRKPMYKRQEAHTYGK